MAEEKMRVLFVCLGNICRSPLAEVVVRSVAEARGLGHYHFESAGTGSWHVGGPADPRSASKASEHGLDLSSHRAQQITPRTIDQWDLFVAMDHSNCSDLQRMGIPADKIWMMRQFEEHQARILDVPDPYYGGPDGFEDAYQMLVDNAGKLLDQLEAQR